MAKFNTLSIARTLGEHLASGTQAKATLELAKSKINDAIKAIKDEYRTLEERREFLKGNTRTNQFKAALTDSMLERGLAKKTAANYLSLITNDCILGTKQFSFGMANGSDKKKEKEKAEDVAVTECPEGGKPAVANSASYTTDQAKEVGRSEGNNGPDVQKKPAVTWHDQALVECDGAVNHLTKLVEALQKINRRIDASEVGEMLVKVQSVRKDIVDAKS